MKLLRVLLILTCAFAWSSYGDVVCVGTANSCGVGGSGTVTGPVAACTDNALPRWDGATTTALQCSDIIVTDGEAVTGVASLVTGTLTDSALTSGRVTYATTSGLLTDDADLTFDGTGMRIGTATTADANADSLFGASATTKKALVLQAKATPTQPPFVVQQSDGTPWFTVTTDGSVLIDQRTAATFTRMLKVSYQGAEKMSVDASGIVYSGATGGFNGGGGFFTTDSSGNVTALGRLSGNHLLSNGTSPTAPAGGGTCGTSAPSIVGKDSGFQLTVGSVAATSCTVTFGTAWTNAPTCVASATTTVALTVATTTTNVTVAAAALTPAEVLHVVCVGF